MSSYDPMFSSTLQALMSGGFICEVSNEKFYSYLSNSLVQDRVNQYLLQHQMKKLFSVPIRMRNQMRYKELSELSLKRFLTT